MPKAAISMEKLGVDLRNKLIYIIWGKFSCSQFLISFVLRPKSQCLTCANHYRRDFMEALEYIRLVQQAGFLLSWSNLSLSWYFLLPLQTVLLHHRGYSLSGDTYTNDHLNERIFHLKCLRTLRDFICNIARLCKKNGLFLHWKHSEIFQH